MTSLYSPPPAEQVYQSYLPGRFCGYAIEKYFAERFPYQSETEWRSMLDTGRITVNGVIAKPGLRLQLHDVLVTRMGPRQEPPANCTLELLFENRHLRVFNKGAPLPIHPCGRYFKNSMTELLKQAYPGETPRPVQRLDALTTGLMVFARTRKAAKDLMKGFQSRCISKEYLAWVEGVPAQRTFVIDQPIGKVLGSARGVGPGLKNPKPARTQFEWLSSAKGRSVLKAIPLTGRTNQIRVHLAASGLPLVNDPIYGNAPSDLAPLGLHALRLEFNCLGTRYRMTAPLPDHFRETYDLVHNQLL